MNIVKLQDDLKSVPDQSLIGYVQNPTGQVPSYLALSELQRRKKMREQAGGQGQGDQPSVAEQLVSEAQPQPQAPQGIAGIPVSNVGNEEAYAAGGIVAFEDGGEVQRFDNGGLSASEKYARALDKSFLGGPTFTEGIANTYDYIKDALGNINPTWVRDESGKLVRASSVYKDIAPSNVQSRAEKRNPENALPPVLAQQFGPPQSLYTQALPDPMTPMSYFNNLPNSGVDVRTTPLPPKPAPSGRIPSTGEIPSQIKQPQGIEQLQYTPMKDRSGEFEISPEVDARTAMEEYRGLVGTNPFQAKASEKLAGMEAANAKYGEQMPWMSLAEAGLAMAAGKSPNALSNIAEGGMKGVAAFKAGQDKIRDAEDKIFNAQAKVAEAQRAEDIAAAKHGVDSSQAAKAARRADQARKLEYEANVDYRNATGKMDIEKFNTTEARRREELMMTERNADKRLQAQLKSAENRATTEDQKLQIASLRSAVTSAQSNVISARKAYSDLIKTGMASPQDVEEAKADLQSAQQSLEYYQGLANENIPSKQSSNLPKLSEKAMKYLK